MARQTHDYVVVGGGLAGGSAIQGIRERDQEGSILLLGAEKRYPYHRPPLSKKLWFGQMQVEDVFVHDQEFYALSDVDVILGVEAVGLNTTDKTIAANDGSSYGYVKLLLATGGVPKRLSIPGADLEGVYYYRYLDDYEKLRAQASAGKSAVVVGGGFIGSEMAAALTINKLEVTLIFPESLLLKRIFPDALGRVVQDDYLRRGVRVLSGDAPESFQNSGDRFVVKTRNGESVESDMVVVGVGISPAVGLAEAAGLMIENGIAVNEHLQTSDPSVYAAGDNALFPYQALGRNMRVEHWDHALNQGRHAGRNMAGAGEPYSYMAYFFSDLFDFGFEAVGDVDSRLETFADWQNEIGTGVVYYLRDGRIVGAMMCNVWGKVGAARELIAKGARVSSEELSGAIR